MVMKNTNDVVFRERCSLSPRAVVISCLLFTVVSSGAFADGSGGSGRLFDVSLPQVNDSNIGYGKNASGAVSDKLFYSLGGGSVISQPPTRSNMQRLGMNLGWSSDLMCGNFDLKTTVGITPDEEPGEKGRWSM